eukprot:16191-Hanusia_phi.AAC.2
MGQGGQAESLLLCRCRLVDLTASCQEAEDLLCEALQLFPNHPAALLSFADLLDARYGDKRQGRRV